MWRVKIWPLFRNHFQEWQIQLLGSWWTTLNLNQRPWVYNGLGRETDTGIWRSNANLWREPGSQIEPCSCSRQPNSKFLLNSSLDFACKWFCYVLLFVSLLKIGRDYLDCVFGVWNAKDIQSGAEIQTRYAPDSCLIWSKLPQICIRLIAWTYIM